MTLQFSPSMTAFALAVTLTAMILGWLAWRRSGYQTSILLLELLRTGIVGLISCLLFQPESAESFVHHEKPTLTILVDGSRSMETQDHQLIELQSGSEPLPIPPVSRRTAAQPLLDEDMWKELQSKFNIDITQFATLGDGMATDVGRALTDAQDQHAALRAVVLASDGDWNTGRAPIEAATRLRAHQIPVFAVPLGSRLRLPDLELVDFDVPTFGIAGKSVRIPLTIESSLAMDHPVQLELRVSDGTTLKHQTEVKAMGRTSDVIVWKPERTGDFTLTLELPPHPSETILDNNSRQAPISIREEKLKVLVIESLPRWEYRFLRNALSRDPGVQVHCLLMHLDLSKVGGGSRDYIPSFPENLDELSQYDVVFLGDVGLSEGQLTVRQCELLAGLVEQQASGLILMPGQQGNQLTLTLSPLSPLIPVVFDESQPSGWGSQIPNHLALTEHGRSSLLTKLADTVDENAQIWERLPGFQWHAAILRAKAGSDVLAVHRESSNQFGRIPLLVTRTFGTGKVLLMGTDGAWRWRRGVEDLYHYRFWGQVVRWMAYQRNMAKGDFLRMFYSPEQPEVDQTVAMSVNAMSKGGEPLVQADVTARIIAPSGNVHEVQFESAASEWGAFAGTFAPKEAGLHQVKLSCAENASQVEATIFVQGRTVEQVGRPMRMDVLEEIARVTRGKVVPSGELWQAIAAIEAIPDPPEEIRRVALWSHPWVLCILVGMFSIFWIGRKMAGAH